MLYCCIFLYIYIYIYIYIIKNKFNLFNYLFILLNCVGTPTQLSKINGLYVYGYGPYVTKIVVLFTVFKPVFVRYGPYPYAYNWYGLCLPFLWIPTKNANIVRIITSVSYFNIYIYIYIYIYNNNFIILIKLLDFLFLFFWETSQKNKNKKSTLYVYGYGPYLTKRRLVTLFVACV